MGHTSALIERFDQSYANRRHPAMSDIERDVCGCAFGATSWTDRAQADAMIAELGLAPGVHVLDLGAGSGWPGLYFAEASGCDVTLVDVPAEGLALAADQASDLGLSGRVEIIRSDAATLDLATGSQGLITHSDVLCCLPAKRAVLENCRRMIAPGGRMLFTVVYIAEGLDKAERQRAEAAAPEFAATETTYPDLLRETGWRIERSEDLTPAFQVSLARQLAADATWREGLEEALGAEAAALRATDFAAKHAAVRDRLVRRAIYRVAPVRA